MKTACRGRVWLTWLTAGFSPRMLRFAREVVHEGAVIAEWQRGTGEYSSISILVSQPSFRQLYSFICH
jgi:hypothetical protein